VIYTFNAVCEEQSALAMDAAGNFFGCVIKAPAPMETAGYMS